MQSSDKYPIGQKSGLMLMNDALRWIGLTEKTIRDRVNIPRDHTYGTVPHELAVIIESNTQRERIRGNRRNYD